MDRELWHETLSTPEGRVLLTGLALAAAGIAAMGLTWLWSPALSQVLVAMTATNVMFGRAAAMSFGYAVGLDHAVVIPINMLVETVLVLLFYPLFVFSWRHVVAQPSIERLIRPVREAAEASEDRIARYGMIGLFVFVWFPFWMTGPVVGCAIGFLLGLSLRVNLCIVLTGTYVAVAGWAVLLRELHDRVTKYSVFGPMILVILLVIFAVAVRLLHRRSRRHPTGSIGHDE